MGKGMDLLHLIIFRVNVLHFIFFLSPPAFFAKVKKKHGHYFINVLSDHLAILTGLVSFSFLR